MCLLHCVTMVYLNKLKFYPQNSFFFPLFLRIDCQNCEQLDLLVWPGFDLMTSLVQVAMVGECRRTSDCARCMQRGVDGCYAPSRSRGKCAFSSHIGMQRAGKFPGILETFHGKFREFWRGGNFRKFWEFSI